MNNKFGNTFPDVFFMNYYIKYLGEGFRSHMKINFHLMFVLNCPVLAICTWPQSPLRAKKEYSDNGLAK
tara:strand:- start:241 stop:447 length:207 start_codon:yes stop_codon:yes gene_type:complete